MASTLIPLHVFLGEAGVVAFLWVFIEMLNPDKKRIERAQTAALLGVILLFAAWIIGGIYYVNIYGGDVKPAIKEGPSPWAHKVFMESKEHIFLFLPFLGIFALSILKHHSKELLKGNKTKHALLIISALIVIIGALMAYMGYEVSSGFRVALEAGR